MGAGAETAGIAAGRLPAGGATGGSGPATAFTFSIMRVYSPGGEGGVGTNRVGFSGCGRPSRAAGGGGVKGSFLISTACLGSAGAGGELRAVLPAILSAPGLTGGGTLGRSAIGSVGAASTDPVRRSGGIGPVMIPD